MENKTEQRKRCKECGKEKTLLEFYKDARRVDGLVAICKVCWREKRRGWRKARREEARKYEREYMRAYRNGVRATPRGIYHTIKDRATKRQIPVLMGIEEFIQWFLSQERICHYCGIRLQGKGREPDKLTFDRKDNSKGYSVDNLALACYRCNQAKGSWFTETQMLEIAERYFKA